MRRRYKCIWLQVNEEAALKCEHIELPKGVTKGGDGYRSGKGVENKCRCFTYLCTCKVHDSIHLWLRYCISYQIRYIHRVCMYICINLCLTNSHLKVIAICLVMSVGIQVSGMNIKFEHFSKYSRKFLQFLEWVIQIHIHICRCIHVINIPKHVLGVFL